MIEGNKSGKLQEMSSIRKSYKKILILIFLTWSVFEGWAQTTSSKEKLINFLPEIPGWRLSQEPEFYGPDNLFEYIDGASEAYLAYDFQGLIVAFYRREKDKEPVMTVEIYDMGEALKAFGIYSSERPLEGHFLEIGLEGYLEKGTLCFLAGSCYVKVFSFLDEKEADEVSRLFGREIAKLIPTEEKWRDPADIFPPSGLKTRTIKFILKNFLGFQYLHHAFLASYEREGETFEAFIIQAKDAAEAESLESRWKKELARSAEQSQEKDFAFQAVNKYLQNIYVTRHDSFLLGLLRLSRADDELARNFIREMISLINYKF